ncbi:CitMHS family transporter [Snodgrassella communis]|jgi:citrate-Mg2+:H+ or citrate-Ca2+:H+ symporter, CitMHS family|uniref:CitMHS family transporter n=1 Tax=Snodgrassella communis TaxID=2946699 RepID=UPI000C1E5EE9|nr:citrate:proton symporter [Snodgrassella communis]PIT19718.1 citrate transporter [Snodgrassella communis]PIT24489.1 citrate transporter [Snodgrassella alvi]
MLTLVGILTIAILLFCIMSKRLSPIVALIIIPVLGAVVALYVVPLCQNGLEAVFPHYTTIPKMVLAGIAQLAPMAAMFVFAIIFFGVVSDAGMFDPIIAKILKVVGTSPKKIIIGTGVLALIAHLDGNGAVTFLITVPAMLPLYDKLGIDKKILAGITALSAGVNFLPWTGPMIRAAGALYVDTYDLFKPLIPAQLCGLAFMVFMGWYWGRKEEKRLGLVGAGNAAGAAEEGSDAITHFAPKELTEEERKLRRPHLFWPNITLVILVILGMVTTKIPPVVIFMVACCVALTLNYRKPAEQSARINAHAKGALMMASTLFAASVFTGIMGESGMLNAMAASAGQYVPDGLSSHIPFIVSLVAMPLSLVFDPDSYYFGIMPVVANIGGFPPIQVAQASLLGQMTTGFPVSPLTPATFLLCSLCGVDLADHQKFCIPILWLASIVMAIGAVLTGVFPI